LHTGWTLLPYVYLELPHSTWRLKYLLDYIVFIPRRCYHDELNLLDDAITTGCLKMMILMLVVLLEWRESGYSLI